MPRRLPTRAKILKGTLRSDRVNRREPKPPLGFPRARRDLPELALREYARLRAVLRYLRVVTVADGLALELCAQALAEYRAAGDVLLRDGQSYECRTQAGAIMRRARPEQAIAAEAWRRAAHMLEQFGLTPTSRGKVESDTPWPRVPAPGVSEDDPLDELQRRRAERRERERRADA